MIRYSRLVRALPLGLLACLGVWATTGLQAQQPAPAVERIILAVNRSSVLSTSFDITRIAVTNPAVADATVVEPRQVLVDGKTAGTVSLIVWGDAQRIQYDIVVDPGVSLLQQRLQALFPGEDIQASQTEESVVLSGHASTNSVMLRAGEIAEATAPKSKVIRSEERRVGKECRL